MKLEAGTGVTIIAVSDGRRYLTLGEVTHVYPWGFYNAPARRLYRLDAEGVWWIRGHHELLSEEAQALIAANALTTDRAGFA